MGRLFYFCSARFQPLLKGVEFEFILAQCPKIEVKRSCELANLMSIAPELLGYIAAFCTTCAFIPQVVQTLKTKNTEAISFGMYSLFVIGVSFWLAYGVILKDLPLIVANLITLCLASTVLLVKIKNTL